MCVYVCDGMYVRKCIHMCACVCAHVCVHMFLPLYWYGDVEVVYAIHEYEYTHTITLKHVPAFLIRVRTYTKFLT